MANNIGKLIGKNILAHFYSKAMDPATQAEYKRQRREHPFLSFFFPARMGTITRKGKSYNVMRWGRPGTL